MPQLSVFVAAGRRRESSYEYGLQNGVGALQGAFAPGCWRWWGSAIVPVNEWTHVGAGVDGTNERHFVNGAFMEQDGCVGSLTINDDDFMIGARGGDGAHGSQFKGSVDEAMVFDSMLADDEVQAIYNAYFMNACDDVDCGDYGSCVLGACECTGTLSVAQPGML